MKPKPIVGETIIAVEPSRRYSERRQIQTIVTKAWRQYFTCAHYGDTRFSISTWRKADFNDSINRPVRLYRTEQEMIDDEEAERLADDLAARLKYISDWAKLSAA